MKHKFYKFSIDTNFQVLQNNRHLTNFHIWYLQFGKKLCSHNNGLWSIESVLYPLKFWKKNIFRKVVRWRYISVQKWRQFHVLPQPRSRRYLLCEKWICFDRLCWSWLPSHTWDTFSVIPYQSVSTNSEKLRGL